MRWLLMSDVHSNLDALDAALRDAEGRWGPLPVACAGDVVGLGASPNECIGRLRERGAVCVAGNHDLMVLGRMKLRCTPAGLRAVEWTRAQLTPESRAWLSELPLVREVPGGFVLCHGSLNDPDEYVAGRDAMDAQLALLRDRFPGYRLMVHGHTHHPVWVGEGGAAAARVGYQGQLRAPEPALANPGSIGQSRTRERLARYAVLDTDAAAVEYGGAPYDTRACARRIRGAGLETRLYLTLGALWARRIRRAGGRARTWIAREAA